MLLLAVLCGAVASQGLLAQVFTTSTSVRAIYRTDLDGSNPSTLDLERLHRGVNHSPQGILIDENRLVWTDIELEAIFSINLDGTDFRTLIDLDRALGEREHLVYGIARSGRSMFWVEARKGIYTAGLDGSNPRRLVSTAEFLIHIAATRTQLFWTNREGLYTADLNGGNVRKLIDSTSSFTPQAIAATRTRLFWTISNRPEICTAGLDGQNPRVLIDLKAEFGEEASVPLGLAVSGSLLYWSDLEDANGVFAARLDGSNPVKLFSLPTPASFLTVRSPTNLSRPLAITDLRVVPDSPPFLRTWKLTWTSEIAERYRIFLSDDLETWLPASGTWLSNRYQTSAEILLPANMPRAFFRVERQ